MARERLLASPEARRLAGEIGAIRSELDTVKAGMRATQLGYSTLHDGQILVHLDGEVRARIGRQSDGQAAVTYNGGAAPPTPSAALVSARQLAVVVGWDGTFTGGVAAPSNLQRVDVHVSETAGYTPSAQTAVVSLFGPGAVSFAGDVDPKYVRLVAVSHAQVASAPSTEVSVTPLPADYIAAGTIGAEELAADIVLTSLIRMYDASGTETLRLDGTTGDVLVTGEYRTAESGERITINETPGRINFYGDTGSNPAYIRSATYLSGDGIVYGSTVINSATGSDGGEAKVTLDPATLDLRYSLGAELRSYVWLFDTDLSVNAPSVFISANASHHVPAVGNAIYFDHYDTAGGLVGTAGLKHALGFSSWAALTNPINNIGVVWGRRGADAAVYVTYGDGETHADVQVRTVFQSSSRASKTRIEPVPFDALAAVRAAPSLMWERPEPPQAQPDSRPPGRPATSPPPPTSSRGVKHFGPMAEDLPAQLVHEDPEAPGGPVVDLGSQIGVLWKGVEQIADRLDAIEARLDAIEARLP